MSKVLSSSKTRKKRHQRIRKKVVGTLEKPRLQVFRSAKHIYAQVINDEKHDVIASASSLESTVAEQISGYTGNQEAASVVGRIIAERAKEKSVEKVVFDRGGYLYHGRVQALADAVREAGIQF